MLKERQERSYIIHTQKGNMLITESEAIKNALQQKKEGIEPSYTFYDYKHGERIGNPGWLVWSTYSDGCGVVHRRDDGKMILFTGWQSDFVYG